MKLSTIVGFVSLSLLFFSQAAFQSNELALWIINYGFEAYFLVEVSTSLHCHSQFLIEVTIIIYTLSQSSYTHAYLIYHYKYISTLSQSCHSPIRVPYNYIYHYYTLSHCAYLIPLQVRTRCYTMYVGYYVTAHLFVSIRSSSSSTSLTRTPTLTLSQTSSPLLFATSRIPGASF